MTRDSRRGPNSGGVIFARKLRRFHASNRRVAYPLVQQVDSRSWLGLPPMRAAVGRTGPTPAMMPIRRRSLGPVPRRYGSPACEIFPFWSEYSGPTIQDSYTAFDGNRQHVSGLPRQGWRPPGGRRSPKGGTSPSGRAHFDPPRHPRALSERAGRNGSQC